MNRREEHICQMMASAHHPQINSIVVWEDGETRAQCFFNGYTAVSRHVIRSVFKSILSVGIGIAQDEGLLNVRDSVM